MPVGAAEKHQQEETFSPVAASGEHHNTIPPHVELFSHFSVDPNYS